MSGAQYCSDKVIATISFGKKCRDGKQVEVVKGILPESVFDHIPEALSNKPIPITFANGLVMEKVIEWYTSVSQTPEPPPERHAQELEEYRHKTRSWQDAFWKRNKDEVLGLVNAADVLDYQSLFEAACKEAARLLIVGDITSVDNLRLHQQAQIAKNIQPFRLRRLADQKIIHITEEQQEHNRLWTSLFKSDEWFEAMFSEIMNPILVSKKLDKDSSYMLLSSMDWDGVLPGQMSLLRSSLKEHDFDGKTFECTMRESGQRLNISEFIEGDYSKVPNLERTLVNQGQDGVRSLQLLYLKSTRVRTLKCDTEASGRIALRCRESLSLCNPKLTWLCVDSSTRGFDIPVLFDK
ncbi:uncharacterized protein B0I36DRAFT_347764 [Microdochium trichocladiopsis]|uniref:SKP1 component POZ domain-containing protein n=1 Tax=Microdochium trichocladiopsis TaxID=1682393 RepID=A0A9P9BRA0_9PEZI|nr:uncharacterized protein B0I36DRAFT_347764 [Microdochium trichocladiopsis]KAH7032575.1 hypothetical protein B0I36DRAFT_347764 [Microdochium trichocladiopsis]